MHPYKGKSAGGRETARVRYAEGGGVGDFLGENGGGAGLLKMAVEPFGMLKMAGKALGIGDDKKDEHAPNFVPKKRGGSLKKGC